MQCQTANAVTEQAPACLLSTFLRTFDTRRFMSEMQQHQFNEQRRACYHYLGTRLLVDQHTIFTNTMLEMVLLLFRQASEATWGVSPVSPFPASPGSPLC